MLAPTTRRSRLATSWWSIVALVLLSGYLFGLVIVVAWWIGHGAPWPATGGTFPDTDIPYQASAVGFETFGYAIAGLPVAVLSLVISSIAWYRAPNDAEVWPMVMTYVSILFTVVLGAGSLFAAFVFFFSLPPGP